MLLTLRLLIPALLVGFSMPALASKAPTIAIAHFDNNSVNDEFKSLGKGIADMLITDLSAVGALQVVERARLTEVLKELELSKSAFVDTKTAQKLGKGLAAQFLMVGAFVVHNKTMRIDARIVAVETGKVVNSTKVEGATSDFFAMEKELVDAIVSTLELKLEFKDKAKLRRNQTQSFSAFWSYAQGIDAADAGDPAAAQKRFAEAISADPNYRAAKTARQRLDAIFALRDKKKDAARASLFKGLDPAKPDFGEKVHALLSSFDRDVPEQMAQHIALHKMLIDQDLAPEFHPNNPGISMVPTHFLSFISAHLNDPAIWGDIAPACEYLLRKYPMMAAGTEGQCKVFLKVVDKMRKFEESQRTSWAERTIDEDTLDWDKSYIINESRIRELIKTAASRAQK